MFSLLTISRIVCNCDCHYGILFSHINGPPSLSVVPRDRTRSVESSDNSVVATVYCFGGWSVDIVIHVIFVLESWMTLRWRHNDHSGVSNHQSHGCLLNRLFRCKSKKHQSSASLAFVREIHRGPVNFPHKWPVTRKMFPFDDVIMFSRILAGNKW